MENKSNKKKVLYLYREIMPYNIPVLKSLSENYNCTVLVFYDDIKKQTPYEYTQIENVEFRPLSKYSFKELYKYVKYFSPDIVFIADITIRKYNKLGHLYKNDVPVIMGNDTQWLGGKQWLNVITSKFRHQYYFSHTLVAGMRQYEYAKRLGFNNDKILFPLYSADVDLFKSYSIDKKILSKAKNILYVGRFEKVKGIKYLLKAWREVRNKHDSKLIMIGNGSMTNEIEATEGVIVRSFSTQRDIAKIAQKCRCFVLPSIFEPWGVVLHEFTSMGMPVIATNTCGSSSHFLINNYNGYLVEPYNHMEIANAIENIIAAPVEKLLYMSKKSILLSNRIKPDMVSSAILSTFKS